MRCHFIHSESIKWQRTAQLHSVFDQIQGLDKQGSAHAEIKWPINRYQLRFEVSVRVVNTYPAAPPMANLAAFGICFGLGFESLVLAAI